MSFFFGTDSRKVVKRRSGEEEEAVIFAFFVIVFERENPYFLYIEMMKFIWKLFGNVFIIIIFTLYNNLFNVLGKKNFYIIMYLRLTPLI